MRSPLLAGVMILLIVSMSDVAQSRAIERVPLGDVDVDAFSIDTEIGFKGVPADQVAFAWVLRLPSHPLPIIGSGQLERVRLAVAASAIEMSREQWFAIWEAGRGVEVP